MRGTSVTGFHFFQGCAPGALVTIFTGFTSGECELLRIRYASLQRSDPVTAYPVPLLCATNNCNFVGTAGAVRGTNCYASGAASGRRGAAAVLLAAALVAAAL